MSIESIHLSEKEKQQLVTLKRRTGLQNWNTICRWALCLSLAEKTEPPPERIPSDSNVDMSWRVFSGSLPGVYTAILRQRARRDLAKYQGANETEYFRAHLHRGISYLLSKTEHGDISKLLSLITNQGP